MQLIKPLRALCLLAAAFAVALPSSAQQYPSAKAIKLIVGFAAGSSADALARLYAQKLSEQLSTPVFVENKPGAGQIPAIRALEMAPVDGHTLYLATGSSLSQGPGIRTDLPYDPLKSFSFVAQVGTSGGAISVNSTLPVRSIADLVAYSKANPGKLSYATAGVGSAGHLCAEYFIHLSGAQMVHVPYKSDPDAGREAAAGTVQVAFTLGRVVVPLASADRVRPLMAIDARRLPYLPNVPSAGETGVKGLEEIAPYTYYGLVGPVGLPAEVIRTVNEAVNKISMQPDVAMQLRNSFISPVTASPAEFRAYVEKEIAKWRKVASHVKIEL